ncbi:MAG: hypothetical protein H7325_10705 [Pedobacter sp.]|nr:hypothetical protein [Pedobacter sp.]
MSVHLILKLDKKDNILAALKDLIAEMDTLFEGSSVIIKDKIPAKHKVFINNMEAGAIIRGKKSFPKWRRDFGTVY